MTLLSFVLMKLTGLPSLGFRTEHLMPWIRKRDPNRMVERMGFRELVQLTYLPMGVILHPLGPVQRAKILIWVHPTSIPLPSLLLIRKLHTCSRFSWSLRVTTLSGKPLRAGGCASRLDSLGWHPLSPGAAYLRGARQRLPTSALRLQRSLREGIIRKCCRSARRYRASRLRRTERTLDDRGRSATASRRMVGSLLDCREIRMNPFMSG